MIIFGNIGVQYTYELVSGTISHSVFRYDILKYPVDNNTLKQIIIEMIVRLIPFFGFNTFPSAFEIYFIGKYGLLN